MKRENLHMDGQTSKWLQELKRCLQRPPILTNPDPDKPYLLLTDASKYYWGTILCQYTCKQNSLDDFKPITFILGKVSDTQCNYTLLIREAFTNYIYVWRLHFYLKDRECSILCNHKLLEKFLKGKT